MVEIISATSKQTNVRMEPNLPFLCKWLLFFRDL